MANKKKFCPFINGQCRTDCRFYTEEGCRLTPQKPSAELVAELLKDEKQQLKKPAFHQKKPTTCSTCGGRGSLHYPGANAIKCQKCNGTGKSY